MDLDVNVCRNECNRWYYGELDNWLKDDVKEEMVGVPNVEVCAELDARFFLRAGATGNIIVGYWGKYIAAVYIYIDRIRKSCWKDRWRQRVKDKDTSCC